MYIYEVKQHQNEILNKVKQLPMKNLHYLVVQQSLIEKVLTLNEIKKHIRRGIKKYILNMYNSKYKTGLENELVKYYCFFETSKDFFWSQHSNHKIDEVFDIRFHFHLFISSINDLLNIPKLISYILFELNTQKNKPKSISKFDFLQLEDLNNDFVLYHTKQLMFRPSNELIMTNV